MLWTREETTSIVSGRGGKIQEKIDFFSRRDSGTCISVLLLRRKCDLPLSVPHEVLSTKDYSHINTTVVEYPCPVLLHPTTSLLVDEVIFKVKDYGVVGCYAYIHFWDTCMCGFVVCSLENDDSFSNFKKIEWNSVRFVFQFFALIILDFSRKLWNFQPLFGTTRFSGSYFLSSYWKQ